MASFRKRLIALGVGPFVDADRAQAILGRAMTRAETLERDAVERHRMAMGGLVQAREELERRVDDLRKFEREYRARLLAYMESQIATLRSEQGDSRRFVLKKGASGKYH